MNRARGGAASERGFILVAVLWILAALATLASVYAVYVDNAAFATHVNDDRLRIQACIQAALELTAYVQTAGPPESILPRGAFALRLGGAAIDVEFVSEGGRLDLNAASKDMLAGLFAAAGAKSDEAAAFADRVIGWRKARKNAEAGQDAVVAPGQDAGAASAQNAGAASAQNAGATPGQDVGPGPSAGAGGDKDAGAGQDKEPALYQAAGVGYAPRQAPFQNVLELPLVLGIPPALVERVLPFVTVSNTHAEIDIRVADPLVLSALPKITQEQIGKILAQRAQAAQGPQADKALLNLLGPTHAGATTKTAAATRVRAKVRLDNGRVALAEVVILIAQDGDEPYRVLSWRDDGDGPM